MANFGGCKCGPPPPAWSGLLLWTPRCTLTVDYSKRVLEAFLLKSVFAGTKIKDFNSDGNHVEFSSAHYTCLYIFQLGASPA